MSDCPNCAELRRQLAISEALVHEAVATARDWAMLEHRLREAQRMAEANAQKTAQLAMRLYESGLPPLDDDQHAYEQWPAVSERPEHRLLALADIGARESHYVYAQQFPEKYPGHSTGGFTLCSHPDCAAVWAAIQAAVAAETTP